MSTQQLGNQDYTANTTPPPPLKIPQMMYMVIKAEKGWEFSAGRVACVEKYPSSCFRPFNRMEENSLTRNVNSVPLPPALPDPLSIASIFCSILVKLKKSYEKGVPL